MKKDLDFKLKDVIGIGEMFDSIYKISIGAYGGEEYFVIGNHEQEALDNLVDHLEERDLEGMFLDNEFNEIQEIYEEDKIIIYENFGLKDQYEEEYFMDEYVVAGNHSRYFFTGGALMIERIV